MTKRKTTDPTLFDQQTLDMAAGGDDPPSAAVAALRREIAEPAPPPAPSRPNGPTTMHQTALVFLEDPIARRLAVAWPVCGGLDARWCEVAGLPAGDSHVQRQRKALLANGICRAGGVTDEMALAYIQAIIARPLARAAKKKG